MRSFREYGRQKSGRAFLLSSVISAVKIPPIFNSRNRKKGVGARHSFFSKFVNWVRIQVELEQSRILSVFESIPLQN